MSLGKRLQRRSQRMDFHPRQRLGIALSHVKRVQTLCPAGSFGHLWTVESSGVCLKVPLIPESNSKARSVRSSVESHWNSQILSLVYLAGSGN